MQKKKLLSLLLAGATVLSLAACGQQTVTTNPSASNPPASPSQSQTADATAAKPTEPTGQLVIGTTTDLENDFYDPSFNNNATNYKLYDLLHGYGTVTSDIDGEWVYDPTVVASHEEVENEDGTKTYTVTINDGLVWSDGTPITAKDYVFAVLLESSPEMAEIGYPSQAGYSLVGYDEYLGRHHRELCRRPPRGRHDLLPHGQGFRTAVSLRHHLRLPVAPPDACDCPGRRR